MNECQSPLCLHCRLVAGQDPLGLCGWCQNRAGVRDCYRIQPHRPPGWGRHLELLAAQARSRLPLLDPEFDTRYLGEAM